MKRILVLVLSVILAFGTFALVGCGDNSSEVIKIGLIREDDTSAEATAWQAYLDAVGAELGITIEYVTTHSSEEEVSAIETFASKGYKAVLSFSDDDVIASCKAANNNEMYVVKPTGHPTDEQTAELNKLPYFLGSIAPTDDTEYQAGYDMAKYFVESLNQKSFTLFGGATCYGVSMHVQRLVGILAYLCEDAGTAYDGAKTREALVGKVIGQGVDPSKFVSEVYNVVAYMDGFNFDDAFSTKLTQGLTNGGTAILSVGAGDAVAGIAYGIASNNPNIDVATIKSAGVDSIAEGYVQYFDLGYTYDCGKFASAMAPGLILVLNALRGTKIVDANGNAPKLGMNYWVATSKASIQEMLAEDNGTDGYCYNAKVINHYIGCSYADLKALCDCTFEGAKAIKTQYGA